MGRGAERRGGAHQPLRLHFYGAAPGGCDQPSGQGSAIHNPRHSIISGIPWLCRIGTRIWDSFLESGIQDWDLVLFFEIWDLGLIFRIWDLRFGLFMLISIFFISIRNRGFPGSEIQIWH